MGFAAHIERVGERRVAAGRRMEGFEAVAGESQMLTFLSFEALGLVAQRRFAFWMAVREYRVEKM